MHNHPPEQKTETTWTHYGFHLVYHFDEWHLGSYTFQTQILGDNLPDNPVLMFAVPSEHGFHFWMPCYTVKQFINIFNSIQRSPSGFTHQQLHYRPETASGTDLVITAYQMAHCTSSFMGIITKNRNWSNIDPASILVDKKSGMYVTPESKPKYIGTAILQTFSSLILIFQARNFL